MCKELNKIMAAEPVVLSKSVSSTAAGIAPSPSLTEHDAVESGAESRAAAITQAAMTACSGTVLSSTAAVTTEMLSPNASSTGTSELEIPSLLHSKHTDSLLTIEPHNQYCSMSDESSSVMATCNDVIDQSSPPHGCLQHGPPLKLQARRCHYQASMDAQQSDNAEQISSVISRADMQPSGMKLLARMRTAESFKEDEATEEAGNDDQEAEKQPQGVVEEEEEEEEEGCKTPTAAGHRIPHYMTEDHTTTSCAAVLVCPPAPKKKPSASKKRGLHHSAGDLSFQCNAARRPFFVAPPDLDDFPDCIRALFK